MTYLQQLHALPRVTTLGESYVHAVGVTSIMSAAERRLVQLEYSVATLLRDKALNQQTIEMLNKRIQALTPTPIRYDNKIDFGPVRRGDLGMAQA